MTSPSDSSNSLYQSQSEEGEENDDHSMLNISSQCNQQHQFNNKNKPRKPRKRSQSSLLSTSSYYNSPTRHITLIQDISSSFFSYLKNLNVINSNNSMSSNETTPFQIGITIKPSEYLPGVFDIINSDNVFINKVLSAFSILFCNIDNLIPHNGYDLLLPLIVYGEDTEKHSLASSLNMTPTEEQEEGVIQIARILPFLSSLSEIINQLIAVSINLINQLSALYNSNSKTYNDSLNMIALNKPFDYLGTVFAFFNAVDLSVKSNPCLLTHWKMYRYMLKKCKSNPDQFNMSIEELKSLDKKITKYSSSIINGKLLDQCTTIIFDNTGKNNEVYLNRLANYIQKKHTRLYSQIGNINETNERLMMLHLLSFIPYLNLIQIQEYSSIYQSIWSIQNKIITIHIIAGLDLNIEAFLLNYKPNASSRYYYLNPKNPKEKTEKLNDEYKQEISRIRYQVYTWLIRMGSNIFDKQSNTEESIIERTKVQIKLIINGLMLLNHIRRNAASLIAFYSNNNINRSIINNEALMSLIESLEIMKVIETQFNNSLAQIALQIGMMYVVIQNKLRDQLRMIEESVIKKYKNSPSFQSDVLAAIDIFTVNLDMVPSHLRSVVNALCFDIIQSSNISQAIKDDIEYSMWELELLSDLTYHIQSRNHCSAFFIRDLIPECFKAILHCFHEDHLTYFLLAISNSSSILTYALHKDSQNLIQSYRRVIESQFEQWFLIPIALELDKDIRLQIALINIKELINDKVTLPDYSLLLSIKPLLLFNRKIDIKGFVEEYLNKSFYEMNTLNPRDWKTYQQMKSYAKMRYSLCLHDTFLPIDMIDKGIDLLEIVRFLPKFIKTYNYDVFNQIFIEDGFKSNQVINIVSSQQIVNSFNTHSIGIINSIINKIFQLIGMKLKEIVAIMVDDRISSIIYKEKLIWNECSSKYHYAYPYVRGHKFLKDNEELISSLISIITQIGNGIALVRTIKTGVMAYIDNSIKYTSNSIDAFISLLSKADIDEGMSTNTNSNGINDTKEKENIHINKSYGNTISIVTSIIKSLTTVQDNNYLYLLVSSFDNAFDIPEIEFYHILLPACFLLHVENRVIANDNLIKKNTTEGHYCNDGFVLGIAYLNKVFKQEQAFESLSWFQSVNSKYEELKEKYSKDESKLMALRKIDLFQKEFELVLCIYQTALMLFND